MIVQCFVESFDEIVAVLSELSAGEKERRYCYLRATDDGDEDDDADAMPHDVATDVAPIQLAYPAHAPPVQEVYRVAIAGYAQVQLPPAVVVVDDDENEDDDDVAAAAH